MFGFIVDTVESLLAFVIGTTAQFVVCISTAIDKPECETVGISILVAQLHKLTVPLRSPIVQLDDIDLASDASNKSCGDRLK